MNEFESKAAPDIEIALLMNRSACQKYPNDINLRIAHNEGWKAARAALAATTANCDPLEQLNENNGLPAAEAVLPEPDAAISEVMELVESYAAAVASEMELQYEALEISIKSKLRALLATATGLPAQAVETTHADFEAWWGAAGDGRSKLLAKRAWTAATRAAAPQAQADAADGMYYLQDARWSAMVGNCPSFWRFGGGYTTNLDEAERFAFKDAIRQHNCRETDLPWLCSELDKLRRPTVDHQYMPRSWDAQRESIAAIAAAKGQK